MTESYFNKYYCWLPEDGETFPDDASPCSGLFPEDAAATFLDGCVDDRWDDDEYVVAVLRDGDPEGREQLIRCRSEHRWETTDITNTEVKKNG